MKKPRLYLFSFLILVFAIIAIFVLPLLLPDDIGIGAIYYIPIFIILTLVSLPVGIMFLILAIVGKNKTVTAGRNIGDKSIWPEAFMSTGLFIYLFFKFFVFKYFNYFDMDTPLILVVYPIYISSYPIFIVGVIGYIRKLFSKNKIETITTTDVGTRSGTTWPKVVIFVSLLLFSITTVFISFISTPLFILPIYIISLILFIIGVIGFTVGLFRNRNKTAANGYNEFDNPNTKRGF